MLEQFQIPEDIAVRIREADMRATVEAVFTHYGMSAEHAKQSADVLLYADLRGYDTHGVSNMLRVYVDFFDKGKINPTPAWKVIRERKATATIDSDTAHGGVIGPEGMRLAIEKARDCGVGVVNIYNGGHYGAAAV
jgi:LDH2 family malate/lactate/ureidoglycolate dehydrogenase